MLIDKDFILRSLGRLLLERRLKHVRISEKSLLIMVLICLVIKVIRQEVLLTCLVLSNVVILWVRLLQVRSEVGDWDVAGLLKEAKKLWLRVLC